MFPEMAKQMEEFYSAEVDGGSWNEAAMGSPGAEKMNRALADSGEKRRRERAHSTFQTRRSDLWWRAERGKY